MKTAYSSPRLINHGNVSQVTQANLANKTSDLLFGTVQGTVPGNGGSLDACIFPKNDSRCKGANLN
ncbi:lasso peptide [Calothrix sp. PCC 6303]|uniref:lasso peptide n=1 Tax=Calothrix sp. PCC 6303 TaxID=1170562 RepID=UPI0002A05834|nr:lasso peptide [Calothrix sp. PCC 6303]AFZ00938.1 hypothetical protein Cal6303_1904 [Calothrix sp. PCC 6303]